MPKKKTTPKNPKSPNDDFLFDDCPICQAMKQAQERGYDLSYEELQVAFAQANKLQSKSKTIN